jgi:DNA-binding GntR family transcriptional regulator
MWLPLISRPTPKAAIDLMDAIEDGRLHSGGGLPCEQNIADSTGVSVDTVRAAFGLLREDGYIETATGIGSFIAEKPDR